MFESIELAAKNYIIDYGNELEQFKNNDNIYISLQTLVEKEYFTENLVDPTTKKSIPLSNEVYVTREENGKIKSYYNINQRKEPKIALNGSYNEYLEMGKEYIEKGITAINTNKEDVSNNVTITGTVDTTTANTYKITYELDNVKITRNVIVYEVNLPTYTKEIIITFNENGDEVNLGTKQKTIIYGETYGELPRPTRNDYVFMGWFTEPVGGIKIINETKVKKLQNHNLYAQWQQAEYIFIYNGKHEQFTIPQNGYYKIELWGASGGSSIHNGGTTDLSTSEYSTKCLPDGTGKCFGGPGAKTSGHIYFNKGEKIYIYIGGKGGNGVVNGTATGGYNGGGTGDYDHSDDEASAAGGGATDIRYFGSSTLTADELLWNSNLGLNSRIMVAAGGGGAGDVYSGVIGGGLIGETKNIIGFVNSVISVPTQTSGNAFGIGQNGVYGTKNYPPAGAGGGYYGGYMSKNAAFSNMQSGGGSSFISGYAGVNAITSSTDRTHTNNTLHYSKKYFIDGEMQAGVNSGNGKATITFLGSNYEKKNTKLDNVRYIKDCINGSSVNNYNHWIELQAIYLGQNIAYGKGVTGTTTVNSGGTGTYNTILDGDITSENYSYVPTGLQCVTIDLGEVHDLDEIAVWHYYKDNRSYNNHSLYVSSDNTNWTTLIDNVSGVTETPNGIRVSAYN